MSTPGVDTAKYNACKFTRKFLCKSEEIFTNLRNTTKLSSRTTCSNSWTKIGDICKTLEIVLSQKKRNITKSTTIYKTNKVLRPKCITCRNFQISAL